jgi:hypothetical protein
MYFKSLADAEHFLATTPSANLNAVVDCIALFPNSLSLLFAAHKILTKSTNSNALEIYSNWAAEKDNLDKKTKPFLDKIAIISQKLKQIETATKEALETYAESFNSHLQSIQKETKNFFSIVPVIQFNHIDEAIKAYEKLKLQLLGNQILAELRKKITYTAIECAVAMDINSLTSLLSESEICSNKVVYQANFKTLLNHAELKKHFVEGLTDEITALLFALARSSDDPKETMEDTEKVIGFILPSLTIENILVILKENQLSSALRHQLFLEIFHKQTPEALIATNLGLFCSWLQTEENLPEEIIPQLARYSCFNLLLEDIGGESRIKSPSLLKAIALHRLQDSQPLQADLLCKIAPLFPHDLERLKQFQERFLQDHCDKELLADPKTFTAFLHKPFISRLLDNEEFKQKLIDKAAADPVFFIKVLEILATWEEAINFSLMIKFCFSPMLENLDICHWPKLPEVIFSLLLFDSDLDTENAFERKVKAMLEKGEEEIKALVTSDFLSAIRVNKRLESLCFTNDSFCKMVIETLPEYIENKLLCYQFDAFLTPNFLAVLEKNRPLEKLFFSNSRFCTAVSAIEDHTFTSKQTSALIKASSINEALATVLSKIPLNRLDKGAQAKLAQSGLTPQTIDTGATPSAPRHIEGQQAAALISRLSVSAITHADSAVQTTPSLARESILVKSGIVGALAVTSHTTSDSLSSLPKKPHPLSGLFKHIRKEDNPQEGTARPALLAAIKAGGGPLKKTSAQPTPIARKGPERTTAQTAMLAEIRGKIGLKKATSHQDTKGPTAAENQEQLNSAGPLGTLSAALRTRIPQTDSKPSNSIFIQKRSIEAAIQALNTEFTSLKACESADKSLTTKAHQQLLKKAHSLLRTVNDLEAKLKLLNQRIGTDGQDGDDSWSDDDQRSKPAKLSSREQITQLQQGLKCFIAAANQPTPAEQTSPDIASPPVVVHTLKP